MKVKSALTKALIMLGCLALLAVAGIGYAASRVIDEWSPLLDQRIRSRHQANSIRVVAHDHAGKEEWVASINEGRVEVRKNLTLPEVNPLLLESIIALEDPRFFSHGGFDLIGIARAAVKNVINLSYKEGASTLTQQLVKNLFLTQEKTLSRKFKEIVISILVERRFQKEEILEAYLNEIFMGQVGYPDILGIQKATEFYFGKDQADLEVPEIALTAAMVAGSGFYSPFRHPERTLARRNKVLKILADSEKITPEEYEAARKAPLPTAPHPSFRSRASYAIEEIRNALVTRDGELKVSLGGYDAEVTLDPELQRSSEALFLKESAGWSKDLQVAMVGIDPRTCEYRVYQGGTSYNQTQFNRLTRSKRPPGSLIKPLLISPLFDKNPKAYLARIIDDAPLTWVYDKGRGKWSPKNYDRKFRGPVSIRTTLEQSLNVPYAKLFQEAVPDGILVDSFAPVLPWGLDIPNERALPSALLGSVEQRPLDMARAYVMLVRTALGLSSFGETGCTPGFLTGSAPAGESAGIYADATPGKDKEGQVGSLITIEGMQGVIRRGTAKVLGTELPVNQPWGGKTGTSSDKRDAWFVIVSPNLVLLAWLGMDKNVETQYTGGWLASHLIAPLVKTYSNNLPPEGFTWPEHSKLEWKIVDRERGCEYAGAYARQMKEKFEDQIKTKGLPNDAIIDGHHLGFDLFKDSDQVEICP